MLEFGAMEKLRFFSFLKLSLFILSLGCYNLIPNLSNLNLGTQSDSSYASYHGAQNLSIHLQEAGKTKTDNHENSHLTLHVASSAISSLKSVFSYSLTHQSTTHSTILFKFSISPRAPPLA